MSSMNNLKYQFRRFIAPAITIIVGFYLYISAAMPTVVSQFNPNGKPYLHPAYTQGQEFKVAALFFVVVGIIWILYLLNVLKSFVGVIVGFLTLAIAGWLLFKDYSIIKKDVDYMNRKELVYKVIKNRLTDLKIAQSEFKNEFGYYTNNMDTLIDYINNGKTIQYKRAGILPNRPLTRAEADFIYGKKANKALDFNMTDKEAKALLKMETVPEDLVNIVRDTIYVPVLTSVFKESSYLEQRKKKGIDYEFHPDSLRLIPFTKNPVLMDTASVTRGELKVPTLLMRMPHPVNPEDTLKIGDLKSNSLEDSWSLSR